MGEAVEAKIPTQHWLMMSSVFLGDGCGYLPGSAHCNEASDYFESCLQGLEPSNSSLEVRSLKLSSL